MCKFGKRAHAPEEKKVSQSWGKRPVQQQLQSSAPSLTTAAACTGNLDSKNPDKQFQKSFQGTTLFASSKADAKAGVLPKFTVWNSFHVAENVA